MTRIKVPMDMYNAVRECDDTMASSSRNTHAVVHYNLRALFAELSRKRPEWVFVSRVGMGAPQGDMYTYSSFDVEVDEEVIGHVSTGTRWRDSSTIYSIDCRGLRGQRQRGSTTDTKDMKKALKLILANFKSMSVGELATQARHTTQSTVSTLHGNASYGFNQTFTMMREPIVEFLRGNWEAFCSTLKTKPHKDRAELLLPAHTRAQEAADISDALGTPVHAVVRLRGNKYITTWGGTDKCYVYDSETLPDKLREPIGMLKLVEAKEGIPGVGIRCSDDVLLVVGVTAPPSTDEQLP